ncbi:UPF0561 protein C2orf68 homolog isoform X1 [Ammospiza nelsoni]|uniref:UPF0561 protein C2orf68 homolog isoform X1 n=1 Tax=Ammospiza nelsoni TaxID=2857394 RepID=UPI00286B274B|nr:UPF0561 protein C2orf68 homolog isoform X1 [Ammospiza nelsoni]
MEAAPATAAAPGWRCRPGGRLDMSHGFVRHIRRNQLARDAYDRAVRQARGRARTRLTPGPARPRRPDQQVYRPHRGGERGSGTGGTGGERGPDQQVYRPHRGGGPGGDASAGSPAEGSGAAPEPARGPRLFCLEYEGDDGRVTAVIVHQGDSAEEVTRRVCAHSPLEPPLRRALCQRVQDELSKRRGTG